ncbi:MAG: VOC family protein [Treponema sp.]|nr:VOC family protein [Treponema sp.]
MNFNLKSLYICVHDMERAVKFYENLLEQSVTEKDDVYSVFDIHGFRLGLFAYEKVGENHEFGSNCLPSISVDSKASLETKIQGQSLCFPLTQIKNNWVVEIIDSEGNHIEMTAPCLDFVDGV